MEISFYSNPNSNKVITTKLCTWHDHCAVVGSWHVQKFVAVNSLCIKVSELAGLKLILKNFKHEKEEKLAGRKGKLVGPAQFLVAEGRRLMRRLGKAEFPSNLNCEQKSLLKRAPGPGCVQCEVIYLYYQVEAEAKLRGWQGFRGWAQIRIHAETTDHSRKLASALVSQWRRSGHVTRFSAWLIPHIFFKMTNHNQHAFNSKYLANLIKKYWTCFRYQKLADFLVCFPPSVS